MNLKHLEYYRKFYQLHPLPSCTNVTLSIAPFKKESNLPVKELNGLDTNC